MRAPGNAQVGFPAGPSARQGRPADHEVSPMAQDLSVQDGTETVKKSVVDMLNVESGGTTGGTETEESKQLKKDLVTAGKALNSFHPKCYTRELKLQHKSLLQRYNNRTTASPEENQTLLEDLRKLAGLVEEQFTQVFAEAKKAVE